MAWSDYVAHFAWLYWLWHLEVCLEGRMIYSIKMTYSLAHGYYLHTLPDPDDAVANKKVIQVFSSDILKVEF